MAGVVFMRQFCRSSSSLNAFGALRLNGLYQAKAAWPATMALSRIQPIRQISAPLSSQVRTFNTSPASKAAPEIEQAGHDHVNHWNAERVMSVILMGVIPAAVVFPSPSLEYLMALSITVHSHWGIEAIVVDYVRPSIFGKVIPKIAVAAVYALSVVTLGGLCYFIYTDVGIVNAVKMLWRL
ncbi:succinate dehydrogenase, subunit D [Oratosquilla oratoria]|uniref:succinate dehydrogenase, subunit D n=1 Tax=Oratosquilla oratoria TaxID=337810 RepID=UPI003F75C59D